MANLSGMAPSLDPRNMSSGLAQRTLKSQGEPNHPLPGACYFELLRRVVKAENID
jgi:hypothetical protein